MIFFFWQMSQVNKKKVIRLAGHSEKWHFCEPLMEIVMEQCWNCVKIFKSVEIL